MTHLLPSLQPFERGVTEAWHMVEHGMCQVSQAEMTVVPRMSGNSDLMGTT